mgnify:CR=1 FL=1
MADFDPTKPVQTRYGSPARIICTDRKGGPPLLALVRGQEREERIFSFYPSGQVYTTHCSGLDLVNVPERESLFALRRREVVVRHDVDVVEVATDAEHRRKGQTQKQAEYKKSFGRIRAKHPAHVLDADPAKDHAYDRGG